MRMRQIGWALALMLLFGSTCAFAQSVTAISFSLGSVIGGNPVTGAVRLTSAAPPGGAVVALVSDNTAAATVPGSVTVAAGATIAHFPVVTYGVASTSTANVTATYNGSVTGPLQVFRAFISSVGLAATALIGSNSTTGTVYLNGQAPPGGLVCTLSTSAACAQVPASVTVAAGTTNVTFTVTTTPVASSTALTVYATALGSTRGVGLKVWAPYVTSVALSPATMDGYHSGTGTVNLSGPAPSGGFTVGLSSSTAWATVPASFSVTGGMTSGTFTVGCTSPHSDKAGTIYSSANGSTRGAGVTVLCPRMATTWTVPASPIAGGVANLDVMVQLVAPPYPGFTYWVTSVTSPNWPTWQNRYPSGRDLQWNGFGITGDLSYTEVPDPSVDTTVTLTFTDEFGSSPTFTFSFVVTHT